MWRSITDFWKKSLRLRWVVQEYLSGVPILVLSLAAKPSVASSICARKNILESNPSWRCRSMTSRMHVVLQTILCGFSFLEALDVATARVPPLLAGCIAGSCAFLHVAKSPVAQKNSARITTDLFSLIIYFKKLAECFKTRREKIFKLHPSTVSCGDRTDSQHQMLQTLKMRFGTIAQSEQTILCGSLVF